LAKFNTPIALTFDFSGMLFVADRKNYRVRKVTPHGIVSTFVESKDFKNVCGIAVDINRNIYVTDEYSVKQISREGDIISLVSDDGDNFQPHAIAVDSDQNIFVSDRAHNKIWKITQGILSGYAGNGVKGFADGSGRAVKFDLPCGIALAGNGTLYVADGGNHRIRRITPQGVVSTLAGSGSPGFVDGVGTNAMFNYPLGLAIDADGDLYVTDYNNDAVRKVTPQGIVTTLDGKSNAHIECKLPVGIAVDANGAVYVSSNHKITKIM